ncbi:serine hydrolase domain-containing protein [Streptacidiphilus sp. N1-12]|uniref:Serine hydrolase domain-containing protein n=2 Tax=Streptacidiphilus alkalitolerans TaxID=3342712 RepID=A0ABV6VIB9_9ACTN
MARARIHSRAAVVAVALCAVGGGTLGAASAAPAPGPAAGAARTAAEQGVRDGYPGVLVYARRGADAAAAAAGVADTASGEPARTGDRFRIASNTKSFVATVLLQLEAEGRLSLDDSVATWLPGVVQGHGNDGTRITVRQLLNQTAGLYDPTTDPGFFAPYLQQHDWGYVYRPRQVVAAAVAHAPTGAPGAAWAYSNTNYLVAGLVIEAVTGHSPAEEIRRRILVPLGMAHTSFPITDPDIHGPHLHGYDLSGHDVTRFSPSYDWTAGAMISTLADLARFDRALFAGDLLPPAQQRELETPADAPGAHGYALAVRAASTDCGSGEVPVWETDGGGPGFTSISLTSSDATRQLIMVGNVFDLGKDLQNEDPAPESSAVGPAQTAVFCS